MTTLDTFAQNNIQTRDDYLFLKKMVNNYPDIFPDGPATDLDENQIQKLREDLIDPDMRKKILKEIRKATKKDDKFKGNGKIKEDPKSKLKKNLKVTKIKKKV